MILRRIRARLVQRVDLRVVGADLLQAQWVEAHIGDRVEGDTLPAGTPAQADPGADLVGAPDEPQEHGFGLGHVARLAQRLTINEDERIGRDHYRGRVQPADHLR